MKTTPQPTFAQMGALAEAAPHRHVQRSRARSWRRSLRFPAPCRRPLAELARAAAAALRHPRDECPTRCIGPIKLGAMTGQTVAAGIGS